MESTKIKVLEAKTPKELAELIEDFIKKNKCFASPIVYANAKFISFVYYEDKLENEKPAEERTIVKATDRQIYTLKKFGIKNPERLTKLEASKLISQYKG